jgi:hypothetical protein
MAAFELADRTDQLFGRAADIELLCARARRTGLTAVIGRPMMGKSWLLEEVARRLAADIAPYHLVGYSRSYGNPDCLLRAVSDLYQRWLAGDRGWQTVRMAWTQQKDRLLPAFMGFLGKLAKDFPGLPKPAGAAIDEALKGLVAVHDTLQSGGLPLFAPLPYDRARELLTSVATLSGRPLVLVLDQWEAAPEAEALPLRQFLRDAESWPTCHIILATSTQSAPAVATARKLTETYPGYASLTELAEMSLDAPEQRRLGDFVRDRLPVFGEMTDADLAAMTEGYPGVLDRWTSGEMVERMRSREDLAAAARKAQDLSFPELEELLDVLEGERLRAAVRIALLPMLQDRSAWTALRQLVVAGLPPDALDRLRQARVLQSVNPPGFGHAKRAEAALRRLQDWNGATVAVETECLVLALASAIRVVDRNTVPLAVALRDLGAVADRCELGPLPQALCQSAAILCGERTSRISALVSAPLASAARDTGAAEHGVLFILAAALNSVLTNLNPLDKLWLRDELLQELRVLSSTHPDDAPLRHQFAIGLFNTLVDVLRGRNDHERRDELLDELRTLSATHADEPVVRELLAKALSNTLVEARDDLWRPNMILNELRALSAKYDGEPVLREILAGGLFSALDNAEAVFIALGDLQEVDRERRHSLLNELRTLSTAHRGEAAVRDWFAKGLFSAQKSAASAEDLVRRDVLMDELRALSAAHAGAHVPREWLAVSLFNARNYAKTRNDLVCRNALMDELRILSAAHVDDSAVRKRVAMGLFNTLIESREESNLPKRDALLDELRSLTAAHDGDPEVRERLAKGLLDTLTHSEDEGDPPRRFALLDELRALSAVHASEPAIRELLAKGLFNTLRTVLPKGNMRQRYALLDELRAMWVAHRGEPWLREWLVAGLVNTLAEAQDMQREAVLQEVKTLLVAHAGHPAVRERLVKHLFNSLDDPKAEAELSQQDALVGELRSLRRDDPSDPLIQDIARRLGWTPPMGKTRAEGAN